jgi:hypothetical protein
MRFKDIQGQSYFQTLLAYSIFEYNSLSVKTIQTAVDFVQKPIWNDFKISK